MSSRGSRSRTGDFPTLLVDGPFVVIGTSMPGRRRSGPAGRSPSCWYGRRTCRWHD